MTQHKIQVTTKQVNKLIADLRALPDRPVGAHLSDDEFIDYTMETLEPPEIERLDTHLASCMDCVAEMERLVGAAEIWAKEPLPPLPTSPPMVEKWWARLWKRVTEWFGPKEPIPESLKTLIIEVARGVVTPLAAEELPLFQATCEAFLKDVRHALKILADQRRPAEMLAFGIEGRTGSITPAVLGVTVEVVQYVARRVKEVRPGESDEAVVELVKVILGRSRPEAEQEKGSPPLIYVADYIPPKWEYHPDRITEVRIFAVEQACRFGLPEEQARRLANALVEHLTGIGA
jgi:hypothetical protein